MRDLAYLARDDTLCALDNLDRIVQFVHDFAPAYQNRGSAYYARGNYGGAPADYNRTI